MKELPGPREKFDFARRMAKELILELAEVCQFGLRQVPKKMTKNVITFLAPKNEIQLVLGHTVSETVQEELPGTAVGGMAVDENAIHVQNNGAEAGKVERRSRTLGSGKRRCHIPGHVCWAVR